MANNPALYQVIREKIQRSLHQRLTFADYMELALYHPEHGYYTSKDSIIGPGGDFITSPHLGHDFGELLAIQFVEMWQRLGRPVPFQLVEMGAGQGLIAADVLGYLQQHHPDCWAALEYWIIEKSEALQAVQRQRLHAWSGKIRWSALAAIATHTITGCWFSNELLDALPVHQVMVSDNGLQEIYVTLPETKTGPFRETLGGLSTPHLAKYFEFVEVDISQYPAGYRTEVNLAALDWLTAVADRMARGFIVTIDYGYPASRYYSPARSQGTLQCYYQHSHHDDPYKYVGQQDITAHVDFTALQRQGEWCGLKTVGMTQQAMFLMALGLGDRLSRLSQNPTTVATDIQQALRRRDTLHQLINPMGLGNFIVLVQGKGLAEAEEQLTGLSIPDA